MTKLAAGDAAMGGCAIYNPSFTLLGLAVAFCLLVDPLVEAFPSRLQGIARSNCVRVGCTACSSPRSAVPRTLRQEVKSGSRQQTAFTKLSETVSSSPHSTEADLTPALEQFNWFKQWYPVTPLDVLDDYDTEGRGKPQAFTILGQKIVIFKSGVDDDGTSLWSALDDTCPHRKAPLSTGKVVSCGNGGCTNNIACRYHGWQFESTGTCTKIPMMDNSSNTNSRAFRTPSYPTKTAGGLLWVFMDPSVPSDALPGIPLEANAPEDEANEKIWTKIVFTAPVSHLSMTENTFDPSHAPFVHEGVSEFGGITYSPETAIPMEKYEIVRDIDAKTGFTLEHTPYQQSSFPESVTTRKFIPPCTAITSTPFSEFRIHFVPQSPRETRTIFMFGIPKPKGFIKRWLMKRVFQSDILHTVTELKDSRTRFNDQDRITMQGQDDRKMLDDVPWADLTPTKSDVGVATYQRWIRKIGGGGPFANTAAVQSAGALSMWESHGKYCSKCRRSLKRVAGLEKIAKTSATLSFYLSGLAGMMALVVARIRESFCAPAVTTALLLLTTTVGLRGLAAWATNLKEKMFMVDDAKRQVSEVYQF